MKNNMQFASTDERRGFEKGYKVGYNEGLRKAIMMLQLVTCSTEAFTEGILQNSPEAKELRKLMTGSEEKTL